MCIRLQMCWADFASRTFNSLILGSFSLGPESSSKLRALPVPNDFSSSWNNSSDSNSSSLVLTQKDSPLNCCFLIWNNNKYVHVNRICTNNYVDLFRPDSSSFSSFVHQVCISSFLSNSAPDSSFQRVALVELLVDLRIKHKRDNKWI